MYVPSCARNNFQGYKRHGQETIAATHCGWDGVQSSVPYPCPSRLDGHGCGGTVAYLRLEGRWASALPAADFSAFVAFGLLSALAAFFHGVLLARPFVGLRLHGKVRLPMVIRPKRAGLTTSGS